MSNPATRQRTAKPDPLVSELIRDYGLNSEAELSSRLKEAEEWARKHQLALIGVFGEGEGYSAKIGPEQCEFVRRYSVDLMAEPGANKSPRHRKMLAAATSLFVYSHPLLRRYVEAGQCEQE